MYVYIYTHMYLFFCVLGLDFSLDVLDQPLKIWRVGLEQTFQELCTRTPQHPSPPMQNLAMRPVEFGIVTHTLCPPFKKVGVQQVLSHSQDLAHKQL